MSSEPLDQPRGHFSIGASMPRNLIVGDTNTPPQSTLTVTSLPIAPSPDTPTPSINAPFVPESQKPVCSLPKPTEPPKPRTFRLKNVPLPVQREQLKTYLNSLPSESHLEGSNVQALSLAPYNHNWLVATVSFLKEPSAFGKCQSLRPLPLPIPTELGGSIESSISIDRITVDCDFYGMTPLYHSLQAGGPEFE